MTEYLQSMTVKLANTMNRRLFIRRAATSTFAGVAALAAGRMVNPTRAFAYASVCESTTGPGCPSGCGPSRCCTSKSGGCQCGNGSDGCVSGTTNCHGKKGDWGGASCWTCTYKECLSKCYYQVSTTCCDCATTGCGDSGGICIAYLTTYTYAGGCPFCPTDLKLGAVAGVATGNPATSWGIQPSLAPVSMSDLAGPS